MPRAVRLRPWQKAALERLEACQAAGGTDFLAVATPGAGKTTFALTAARQHLARHPGRRLVVCAPTAHLKAQWAAAAARMELHLEPEWSAADGRLPSDFHGIVTTYQQVASSAAALAGVAGDAFVVLDELHHAGDERAWGDSVRVAFGPAPFRLALSGTPFRSDTRAIPFVRYRLEEAEADYEYGYGDALTDGRVVRPVWFPRLSGEMEWTDSGGNLQAASFDDELDSARSAQRLRTALSLEGEWLPAVLRAAHAKLTAIRAVQPDAGGLVIATDQDHARGIAQLLQDRFRTRATVVLSDDPMASARIARFSHGTDPWIVAVRMVSEGVDIPRLRVGVYATTTSTELFFRQAVGRLVRWTPGSRAQRAFFFIPDDPRLRARAFQIADQRRHSLRRREAVEQDLDVEAVQKQEAAEMAEQLSLFQALSATPIEGDGFQGGGLGLGEDEDWGEDEDAGAAEDAGPAEDGSGLWLELAPPPPVAGARGVSGMLAGEGAPTLRDLKKRLRDENAAAAKELARRTGWTHAKVNAELNRLAGVARITEATTDQLQRRLKAADRWLLRT